MKTKPRQETAGVFVWVNVEDLDAGAEHYFEGKHNKPL
jgi:hypothetical protein